MAIRTYKVTLDSKNTIAPEPVYLRQGDKTGAVVIDATLMDNGSPVSLSGLTPMFKANTADGQAVIADSTGFTVTDSANGKFTYQVPNALSAVPGKITTAYFSLSDADGSESTFDVAFIIKAAVDISQGQADDYITIIDGTLQSLQQKIDAMNTSVQTILNAYNQGDFYNKSETDSKDAEVTAQLAQTIKKETLHYYVGVKQTYQTISSAFAKWKTDGKPDGAIIHIAKGEYNEKISEYSQCNLQFVGENKDAVIWRTKTGYYQDSPLTIQGEILIKGITFIADSSDNPNYSYTPYVTNTNTGAAYGLHIDIPNAVGKTIVEDCRIISYQNAAIGCGTDIDSSIEINDCEVITYAESADMIEHGALLYHNSHNDLQTNQKISLYKSKFYSENGRAVEIKTQNTDGIYTPVEIVSSNFESGVLSGGDLVRFYSGVGAVKTVLTENSYGNNVLQCNFKVINYTQADFSNHTASAVGDTTLKTVTIAGGTVKNNDVFRFRLYGLRSGVVGNKTINLMLGTTSLATVTVTNETAWGIEGEFGYSDTKQARCLFRSTKGLVTSQFLMQSINTDFSDDVELSVIANIDTSGQAISMFMFDLEHVTERQLI